MQQKRRKRRSRRRFDWPLRASIAELTGWNPYEVVCVANVKIISRPLAGERLQNESEKLERCD